MTDFPNALNSVTQMVTGNPGINMGTTGSMRDTQYYSDDLWDQHSATLREQHASRSYARADRPYEYYEPAYRYGASSSVQHRDRGFHEVEGDLERGWEHARGTSTTAWHEVKDAARDAWEHARGHGGGPSGGAASAGGEATPVTVITPR